MGDSNTKTPDFSGWATKNDLVCTDGVTIKHGAFKHNDAKKVPLVWQHQHKDNEMVLGHVILEHRDQGTYAHAYFNETRKGQAAKLQVEHGDIDRMSIWANDLVKRGEDVLHGDIKEVSLVLAGANPGAAIETVYLRHADGDEDELDQAIIHTGLTFDFVQHEDGASTTDQKTDGEGPTVQERFDKLSDDDKDLLTTMVSQGIEAGRALERDAIAAEGVKHSDTEDNANKDNADENIEHAEKEEGNLNGDASGVDGDNIQHGQKGTSVTNHNVFEGTATSAQGGKLTLSHDAMKVIMTDAANLNSLEKSILKHAATYGIDNIELLFPDAKLTSNSPEILARQTEWVPKVLNGVKQQPFAAIKSVVADLTAEEARAKGYIKGNEKKEEVIGLLRRSTTATTIYKKQKLDRDDVIDITDFDVITWIKWEIRFMLNEELARAILIGDGRSNLSEDKVKDPAGALDGKGIRSIYLDNPLYAVRVELQANVDNKNLIKEITRSRTEYRGSGSPTLYTTDKVITDLLLLEDKMGRRLYETEAALASAIRVKEIVAVEVMEQVPTLLGIIVNLVDYTVGTNKGGELSFFEDFDLDFNANKYLLETRVSGALTKPKSALVITRQQGTLAAPVGPSFNGATNTITVPTVVGIDYVIDGETVTGDVVITQDTEITAEAEAGYYIPSNSTTSWTFSYND